MAQSPGSGFDRLSGTLQYHIVNSLGWHGLRPVQDETIHAVLDGRNCVVLAPTAGGKTEAAFFPLLSQMDSEDWQPVSVVYLSPIRALLNNQEERIQHYAGLIGRRVFKWHGDVKQGARKQFLNEPADILMTTPESLEAMLMSTRVPAAELFSHWRTVIIDEIHAFAGDDRGAHLASVLERFNRFCGRDVQRIGLSATVGNPEEILRWAQGSSQRQGLVVDPRGAKKKPKIVLDYVASHENAATMIKQLHPGRKRLVFVESRRVAEEMGKLLIRDGVDAFVIHGSLSFPERRLAEEAFHQGQDCVIVATSALELGIDVGDLDHVLQIDSPSSVASFLQRMGRTGRRADTLPNCTFLVTKEMLLLQAAGILDLHSREFVEDVTPSRRASHILAHQLMALSIQLGGVPASDWWAWISGATCFADLNDEQRQELLDHMYAEDILSLDGGRIWLGEQGEKLFGGANFRKLYAVFDVPPLVSVRWNKQEIGQVDTNFLTNITSDSDKTASFILAGRAWEVVTVDWDRFTCVVRPASGGRAASWFGGGRFLSYELCQSMRRVLIGEDEPDTWSERTKTRFQTMRAEFSFLHDARAPILEAGKEIVWWTFAGGGANVLLARMLESKLGEKVLSDNFRVRLTKDAAQSGVAFRQVLDEWANSDRPNHEDANRHAEEAVRGRISKFQKCLTEQQLLELIVDRIIDVSAAKLTANTWAAT